MKTPTALLVLGVATIASTQRNAGLVQARPMHADIDYSRYLLEKEDIKNELKNWMAKWKGVAQKNGWIPILESRSATDDDIEEDHKQRFFLAKQLVQKLKTQNPDAEFSTDSPFTLLTTDEFSSYVKNSYIAGGAVARQLRGEAQQVEEAETPASTPAPAPFDFSNINFNDWFRNIDWSSLLRPTAAPTTSAPVTKAPVSPATAVPATVAPVTPTTTAPATTTTAPVPAATTATPRPAASPTPNPNLPVAPVSPSTDSRDATPTTDAARDANSLDWSAGKCMSSIQNQGQCGDCWAFASVAAVETAQCIAQGAETVTKYSEQNLASCDNRNGGCNGGVPLYAMQYIQQNGLCTLADDPYTSGNGQLTACNTGCKRVQTGMKGVQALAQNEAALMKALNTHPVVVAVQAGNDVWKQYKSGVLAACPDPNAGIDHAVVAVGYDATTIKIRNSWGSYWGEAGYIRLARSTAGLGTCKILQQMVDITF